MFIIFFSNFFVDAEEYVSVIVLILCNIRYSMPISIGASTECSRCRAVVTFIRKREALSLSFSALDLFSLLIPFLS